MTYMESAEQAWLTPPDDEPDEPKHPSSCRCQQCEAYEADRYYDQLKDDENVG